MTAFDHHRQLQRAPTIFCACLSRSTRPHPRIPTTSPSSTMRRRWVDWKRSGLDGRRSRSSPRSQPWFRRGQQRRDSGDARRPDAAAQQRHVVPAGALDDWSRASSAHPLAAAAGPRLIDRSGRAELSFGPAMSPLGELRQKAVGALYGAIAPIAGWVERRRGARMAWTGSAARACWSHRADAEASGLLDERFFLYTEDVDFCAAHRARGRRILFAPVSGGRAPARALGPAPAGANGGPTVAARSPSTRSIIRAGPGCCAHTFA